MRKPRFTYEQIVAIIRETDRGHGSEGCQAAQDQRADDLRLEEAVRGAAA